MSSIRRFENSDLQAVLEISEIALQTIYEPRFYISIKEAWPDGFMVAGERGRVVGFIAGTISHEDARILMLAVHPDFRMKGIGGALIEALVSSAAKEGAKRIYLEVRKSNSTAVNFYIHRGFSIGTAYHSYYEDGEDALIMWRTL